jgi:hypothetical protein
MVLIAPYYFPCRSLCGALFRRPNSQWGKRECWAKLKILFVTDFKLGARVSKIHDRISITHALVFIIFSGCATLESGFAHSARAAEDQGTRPPLPLILNAAGTEHRQIKVDFSPVNGGGIQCSISAVFQRIAYELCFLFVPGGLIGGILLRILKRAEKIQL